MSWPTGRTQWGISGRWNDQLGEIASGLKGRMVLHYNFMMRLLFFFALLGPVARAELVRADQVETLRGAPLGPFVRVGDGAIWGMEERGALISHDEGKGWAFREIFDQVRFQSRKERALLRTREGVLLYAFLNERERVFKWDDQKGGPQEGCRLPVYVARSADDGKTWSPPVLLQDGWCGAVRQMIQLRTGRVVLVSQQARANPGRHITLIYVSDDLGKTWQVGAPIDLGSTGAYGAELKGINGGTHGGGLEGTVFEKKSGELELLLRVPRGHFEKMTSKDGLVWGSSSPSMIAASDSPGMVVRLASGRLALLWNRFVDPVKQMGRREELSLAFSNNDGLTWTSPQVIAINRAPVGAREGAFWIAYPYVFEAAPGRLWISTMQGDLRVALREADFIGPVAKPLDGPAARIITLGDSITKGARPGVSPAETFGAHLQGALRSRGLRAHVHNIGIGGERTDQARTRLESEVVAARPQLVTVMYGTNDSWVDEGKTASRLSVAQFEENLRAIVDRLQAEKIAVVLMTAPKFGEENRRNGLGEDPNIRLARYMEITRQVARQSGLPLVDHFAGWADAQERGQRLQAWTTDGCHPNRDGHREMAGRMAECVAGIIR